MAITTRITIPITRPWLGEEEAEAARSAILSGWVAQGPRVAEFEHELARKVGAGEGVAVSSCTTGLHLVLHALGIGAGDDVVVPSLSFIASANVVVHAGAQPVFADVSAVSQNLDVRSVRAAITPKTRAVIVAHQVGEPADVDALSRLCDERGITLVEDAACAIGSTYEDLPIGGHGNVAVFSFHPRKILTTGEGGMITCDDPELAGRLRKLRNHAMSASASERKASAALRVTYDEVGYNYRMTDIQAAVGLQQLGKLDAMLARRREQAGRYNAWISDAGCAVELPPDPLHGDANYQSYTLKLPGFSASQRDDVVRALRARGVGAIPGIAAAHRETVYARTGTPANLPWTDSWADRSVMLPLYHELSEAQQQIVVSALVDALQEGA